MTIPDSEWENGIHPRVIVKLHWKFNDTWNRIHYAIKIRDWICLQDCFNKFNMQFQEFRKTTEKITNVYLHALVTLEETLLMNHEQATKKRKMTSSRNADALSSVKHILIKCLKQYEDLVTEYKAQLAYNYTLVYPNLDWGEVPNEWRKREEDKMFGSDTDTYDSAEENQPRVEPWVKDYTEIEWHRVEKLLKQWSREKPELDKLQQLTLLRRYATTPAQELKIIFEIIDTLLRFNQNHYKSMSDSLWEVCLHYMLVALDILAQHPKIFLCSIFKDVGPDRYETQKTAAYRRRVRVRCKLVDVLERIYNEFYRRLNFVDPHTACYAEKLKDEAMLFLLSHNVFDYLIANKNTEGAAKAALLRAELVYYKSQEEYDLLLELVDNRYFPHLSKSPVNCREFMDKMVSFIYSHGDVNARTQGMIYNIYHYAVTDDYSNGSELALNSKLNAQVNLMSVSTKIQFNRAMAKLGVCAFRTGHIKEAYKLLFDLFEGGRMEDLLAQGFDVDYKQVPYHKHINLELLEGVHLTCAMLMGRLERRNFTAHSKNILDHVMVVSKALKKGNYYKTFKIIKSLEFWKLIRNPNDILKMIETKFQEEALKSRLVARTLTSLQITYDMMN